jgi:hypothetical protein
MRDMELQNYLTSIPDDLEYNDFEFYSNEHGWEIIVYTNLGEAKIMWYDLENEIVNEFEDYETVLSVDYEYGFSFKFKIEMVGGEIEFLILDLETKIGELCKT